MANKTEYCFFNLFTKQKETKKTNNGVMMFGTDYVKADNVDRISEDFPKSSDYLQKDSFKGTLMQI